MHEMEAAKLIADGKIPSPHQFGEMTLWALRATGTGVAYRNSLNEFVYRDPQIFLSDDFVARVGAGVPVVWEHPVGSLDSKEFESRVVGSTMYGFVRGDDVWCIARLYDAEAIRLMKEDQLSTSPGVVFRPGDGNERAETDDGTVLLIEGIPSILSHLAICSQGVWDKNLPPSGVSDGLLKSILTESAEAMASDDNDKAAADAAKHDSDIRKMDERMTAIDAKFDAVMDAVMSDRKDRQDAARRDGARKDKFGKRKDGESYKDWKDRHDADEKAMCDALRKDSDDKEEDCMDAAKDARKDAEEDEKRSDKDFEKWAKEEEKEPEHKGDSKKDAEEDKKDSEEEKKEDSKKDTKEVKERETNEEEESKKDSVLVKENAEMKLRVAALEAHIKGIKRETPREEIDALAAAQSRADSVAAMFGDRAPPPIPGENPLDYRKRLIGRFKRHSPDFKDTRFDAYDAKTLGLVEDQVYRDAVSNARAPGDVTPGVLVPYVERDRAGREITRYHGDVGAFLAPFVPQEAQMVRLNVRRGN